MSSLINKLRAAEANESFIGLCPFPDGEGEVWGRVIDLDMTTFTFAEVDVFGHDIEMKEYEYDEIVYSDDNPTYARRLALLQNYAVTLPIEVEPITDPVEIRAALRTANVSDEIVRISFPGNSLVDVSIDFIDDHDLEITNYDNLMRPTSRQFVNLQMVSELVWRDATCQAENYLRGLVKDLSVAAGPKDESRNLN